MRSKIAIIRGDTDLQDGQHFHGAINVSAGVKTLEPDSLPMGAHSGTGHGQRAIVRRGRGRGRGLVEGCKGLEDGAEDAPQAGRGGLVVVLRQEEGKSQLFLAAVELEGCGSVEGPGRPLLVPHCDQSLVRGEVLPSEDMQ